MRVRWNIVSTMHVTITLYHRGMTEEEIKLFFFFGGFYLFERTFFNMLMIP